MMSPGTDYMPFPDLVLRRALRCATYLAGAAAALLVFLAFLVTEPHVRAFAQPTPSRCAALQAGSRAPKRIKDYAECTATPGHDEQETARDKQPLSQGAFHEALTNLILDGFFGLMAAIRDYVLLSLALGFAWAAGERFAPSVAAAWRRLSQEKCS